MHIWQWRGGEKEKDKMKGKERGELRVQREERGWKIKCTYRLYKQVLWSVCRRKGWRGGGIEGGWRGRDGGEW